MLTAESFRIQLLNLECRHQGIKETRNQVGKQDRRRKAIET